MEEKTFNLNQIATGTPLLITTNDWFTAKDGNNYKGAWGTCKIIQAKDLLGFNTKHGDESWYMQVGTGEDALFIAGCQVRYAQLCTEEPESKINNILILD